MSVAAVHGLETQIIANKENIQTDHLNSQDRVYSVWGQKRWNSSLKVNNLATHLETASRDPEHVTLHA
jgi:hypothetical protein